MTYTDFLQTKLVAVKDSGFEWQRGALPEKLFDWQKDIVLWALRCGKAALFEDCGLGKTPQQLAWAQAVSEHERRPVLILAPLAVSEQTKREGVKFGVPVTVCRTQADVRDGVNITNYEMMQHFDAYAFCGVVLDESSILKAYMGKTKRALVEKFAEIPYKLACTATPAPNDLMELLNHAEYLGIMRSSEALSIWFIADQTNSGTYRLKGHAERDFWSWVSSWAVCLDKPSDMGYADGGFDLPELHEQDRVIQISEIADDFRNGFIRDIDLSATGFYREKRRTLDKRVAACAEIVNSSGDAFVVGQFLQQHGFMVEHLIRILKPGRLAAVHCKQLAMYKGRDGASGWQDFRGDLIRHFEGYGFQYHSEVVIWTDPVLEMQKTKTQRLLYCQLQRDASLTGIGMPEYLLLFRKWPKEDEAHEPIRHFKNKQAAEAGGGDARQVMDLDVWQRYASPVWFDIRRTDVLNVRIAREDKDEKHICPLQLEVIRRAVQLWSNPGEVVFTPFMGIGSEAYVALEQGRKAVGVELKSAYFNQAVTNCNALLHTMYAPTLMDYVEDGAE